MAEILITGLGSVSAFGPRRGLLERRAIQPQPITRWPTRAGRRAFLVDPFRPADVVPGLKTRRLDRLSAWALVAAALALQDGGVNPDAEDPTRLAVVLGTGLGCVELTGAFLSSAARNGYAKADPILFPETLSNCPPGHVARQFGIRGPNVTVSCGACSGEAALLVAASLLASGECDCVIAVAGDTLTEPVYEWYEAGRLLRSDMVMGEGAGACLLETGRRARSRDVRVYRSYHGGALGGEAAASIIARALGGLEPSAVALVAAGSRTALASAVGGAGPRPAASALASAVKIPPSAKRLFTNDFVGQFDGSGILRLILALSGFSEGESAAGEDGLLLLLAASARGESAAVTVAPA